MAALIWLTLLYAVCSVTMLLMNLVEVLAINKHSVITSLLCLLQLDDANWRAYPTDI